MTKSNELLPCQVTDAMRKVGKDTLLTMLRAPAHNREPLDYELTVERIYTAMATASTIPTDDEDAEWLRTCCPHHKERLNRIADRLSTIPSDGDGVVERFIQMLEQSADVQGVHIDYDECAALAVDLRAALTAKNSIGGLVEALAEHDAAVAKCPIQKGYQDVCPSCKATSSEGCGVVARADYALVEAVRGLVDQGERQ